MLLTTPSTNLNLPICLMASECDIGDIESGSLQSPFLFFIASFSSFLKDRTFVNAKLIEDGNARAYFIPPNVKYYSQFKKLEKEAMKNRKGLWSETDSISPISHSDAIRHIGKFRFVEGVVRSIHNTGKAVHLNFGNNPDEDFTVTIFDRDYQRFREKGIDPSGYYEGKAVAVYGKIKLYRGAEIVVSFPEDIVIQTH